MRTSKLVIFDFDGAMVDTFDLTYSIRRSMEPELSEAQFRSYFKGNIHEAPVQGAFTREDMERLDRRYIEGISKKELDPGIVQAVRELSLEYQLIVVSSTPSRPIELFHFEHGIRGFIHGIYGSDFGTSKSEKMGAILAEYRVSPRDAVFITDTVGDIEEAREAGVESIGVSWGYHDAKTLESARPALVVSEPERLAGAVRSYFDRR